MLSFDKAQIRSVQRIFLITAIKKKDLHVPTEHDDSEKQTIKVCAPFTTVLYV